jgi:hypothetical protein
MHKPLSNLADIRVGYSFRTKIKHDPLGSVPVLQIKDITRGRELRPDQLPRLRWPTAEPPPCLSPGDIVLPARGDHYSATMLPAGPPIVASSQLFVLSAHSHALLPEYLCWYLNRPQAQNYFLANRAGSSIPMLNKQSLGALDVQVPPLETQQRILLLQAAWERERALTQQLLINRQKMLDGVFDQLLES